MEAQMSNFAEKLYQSPKYSDLKLVCQGHEFKVHKAVVCTQSPVLSASCDGNFQEAATNTVHVTAFDLSTVTLMIQYLYLKWYNPHSGECNTELRQSQTSAEVNESSKTGLADEPKGRTHIGHGGVLFDPQKKDDFPNMSESNATMVHHVRVNAIADYYDIQPLKKLATEHIKEILQRDWSADGFSVVVQEVLDCTGDKVLHDIISSSVAANIEKLITREDFTQISVMSPFLVDTIKKIGAKQTKQAEKPPPKVVKRRPKTGPASRRRTAAVPSVQGSAGSISTSSSSPSP